MGVFRQFGECRLGLRPAKNGIAEQPLSPKVHFTPWGVGWGVWPPDNIRDVLWFPGDSLPPSPGRLDFVTSCQ